LFFFCTTAAEVGGVTPFFLPAETCSSDPKDGELYRRRAKSGEIPMEARKFSDVQIDFQMSA